eukprot:COSAG02_NODE_4474_length_5324_cov_19.463028_3_plen_236_part_00
MRSEGSTDADILDAKIAMVYQWADAITGDGLCPAEIMRLADELPIRWGSTVVRSKDRRSGSAVNFLDAQELVQVAWHDCVDEGRANEPSSWVSVWELDKYGSLCNILKVEPLAQNYVHSVKTPSTTNTAIRFSPRSDENYGAETAFAVVTPLGTPRWTTAAGHHRRVDTQAGTIDKARFEHVCRQSAQVYEECSKSGRRLVVCKRYGELWFEDLRLPLRPKRGWRGCLQALCYTR